MMKGLLPIHRSRLPGLWVALLAALWLGWLGGCTPASHDEGVPLARVGKRDITVARYRAFYQGLPEGMRSQKPGIDGHSENLQSLIDRELLVLEARSAGLDRDPEFLRKLHAERDRRILATYLKEKVRSQVQVSDAEVERHFAATGRDRERRLRVWVLADSGAAMRAHERLQAGAVVAVTPAPLTEVPGLARPGAATDGYLPLDAVHPVLREAAFALPVGRVSQPIAFRGRHLLVQATQERPAEFARYRVALRRQLEEERFEGLRAETYERLRMEYRPEPDPEGLPGFLAAARGIPLEGARAIDPAIALYRFRGGTLTSGRFIDQVRNGGLADLSLADSAQVTRFAEETAIPQELILAEARSQGLDSAAVAWTESQRERRLADELIRRAVESQVGVTPEEAEQYYRDHPDLFDAPTQTEIDEILVETEEEARRLRQQIEDGDDVAELAQQHSLRKEARQTGGRFHLHPFEAALYGGLVEAVGGAVPGELTGPVPVEGGYSVFRVVDRDRQQTSFADRRVRYVAANIVRKIKTNERFDGFVEDLRQKYEGQVRVYRDRLRVAVAVLGEGGDHPG